MGGSGEGEDEGGRGTGAVSAMGNRSKLDSPERC